MLAGLSVLPAADAGKTPADCVNPLIDTHQQRSFVFHLRAVPPMCPPNRGNPRWLRRIKPTNGWTRGYLKPQQGLRHQSLGGFNLIPGLTLGAKQKGLGVVIAAGLLLQRLLDDRC